MKRILLFSVLLSGLILGCTSGKDRPTGANTEGDSSRLRVIFDTDANNELDDQHALAYLLFNGSRFSLAGITVNATRGGGRIGEHYAEAERVMRLCGYEGVLPIYKGANSTYDSIISRQVAQNDGEDAVNFIVNEAKNATEQKLVVIAVGKLTNLALALKSDPTIASQIRLVWLGANYPDPGEYNLVNDTASLSYVLRSDIEFEMVTVRYGRPSGSDAVRIYQSEVNRFMPGKGPIESNPVTGRHGGSFKTFGDYSVSLFEHASYHDSPPSRALFDMVAVAVVKNPDWGKKTMIHCPKLMKNLWIEQPENPRMIAVWENFDKDKIMADFFTTLDHPRVVRVLR